MTGLKFVPTTENIERRTRHNGTVWDATDDEMREHALWQVKRLREELASLERRLKTGNPSWETCHNLSEMLYDVHDMRKELGERFY